MSAPIRVLIADDHPLFRDGLRGLLESVPDLSVVGEATNGQAAVEMAVELRPDVVLMDLQMPAMNGIEATRQIAQSCPGVGLLILTMFEDDESVYAAMRAGARGYLLKDATQEETLRSIRTVAEGGAVFGAAIARRVLGVFATPGPASAPLPFPELTEREREVLGLMAQGRTNHEIAKHLVLSPKTAANYASLIIDKLGVQDRAQAALRAREAGLG